MYVVGVDIGSSSSKAVALEESGRVVAKAVVDLGTGTTGAEAVMGLLRSRLSENAGPCAFITATGYGRRTFPGARSQKSELSCHARGVHALFPSVRTVIDIGGQDSKVMRLMESGSLEQFLMNDKCAAGTGRFLEMMSRVLDLDLRKFGSVDLKAQKILPISSTCSVFAESEVISLLSQGKPVEEILAGIHQSVASKVGALVRNIGILPDVAVTGGVAQNSGVVRALERLLHCTLLVPDEPQLTGAIGAALFALEEWRRETDPKDGCI